MLKNFLLFTEDPYVVHILLIEAKDAYKFSINNEWYFNIKNLKCVNSGFKYNFKKWHYNMSRFNFKIKISSFTRNTMQYSFEIYINSLKLTELGRDMLPQWNI